MCKIYCPVLRVKHIFNLSFTSIRKLMIKSPSFFIMNNAIIALHTLELLLFFVRQKLSPVDLLIDRVRGACLVPSTSHKQRERERGVVPTKMDMVKDFVAGGAAGVAQVVSSYPLDTIKTRLQGERDSGKLKAGTLDTLRKTIKYEGIAGLYKGMSAPVAGIAFLNSLLFAANERFKRDIITYKGNQQPLGLVDIALAGALAGAVQSVAASPVELVKTKLQMQFVHSAEAGAAHDPTQQKKYAGPVDCMRRMYQSQGLARGIFKGFQATLYRDAVGYAAFYAAFHKSTETVARAMHVRVDELNPLLVMCCGASSGISYWTACYPLDSLKTLVQNDNTGASTLQIARRLYAQEGMAGFWRGYTPACLRAIPAASSTFLVFTILQKFMK